MSGAKAKEMYMGIGLMIGFIVVLVLMFLPLFDGKNGLNYMDDLYNKISKGSAYYIPKIKKDAEKFNGKKVSITLNVKDAAQVNNTKLLLEKSGMVVIATGNQLKVDGDFGKIMAACLEDSDLMFNNAGDKIKGKYSYDERQVLYNWYNALAAMDKSLSDQKLFAEANFIKTVSAKGVECSYNYYKITPQKISEQAGIVLFSLIFYVVYTMWYGFSIMYMFEGAGLDIGH
jgi:hypothetical protein